MKARDVNFLSPKAARILCVDDNPSILRALKMGLSYQGFEVVTADNGVEALKEYHACEGGFGAILTDKDMPKMGGFELAHCLREEGFEGRIFVMSGALRAGDAEAHAVDRISGFFQKPFELRRVTERILEGG